MKTLMYTLAVTATAALLAGCQCLTGQAKAQPKKVQAAPEPAPLEECAPYEVGTASNSQVYPYGCDACGVLMVEKSLPEEVQVGQTVDYRLRVSNLTDMSVEDVVVQDDLAGNFNVTETSPQASVSGNTATWELGTFAPGETRTLRVSGKPTDVGELTYCGTATFKMPNCVSTQVVQPGLDVMVDAPATVLKCDTIPLTYTVANTGSGVARDVVVRSRLPNGLATPDGKQVITFPACTMRPGLSRELTATAVPEETGTYEIPAQAEGVGGLEASAAPATVQVVQPVLQITKDAPERTYVDQNFTHTITVRNVGDTEAQNTQVTDTVPASAEFVSASQGGSYAGGKVTWNLGSVASDASRKLSVTLRSSNKTRVQNTARATAVCADAVTATASTNVRGIPAILLEVIDEIDPVAIGKQTTYVITATNQGSAVGTNIQIVCKLEKEQQYVSSSGATNARVQGRTITFQPLSELPAKEMAQWRVTVQARQPGDVRFNADMNSDQLTRPVQESEATHFYK